MNRFTVTLLEESIDDITIGKRFYDASESGVGLYFANSAMADIASLRLYAGIHLIRFGYHRMLLKRFPFSVYYESGANEVRLVAVIDMRQNPKSIRSILRLRHI
jgi:hypothetical protein